MKIYSQANKIIQNFSKAKRLAEVKFGEFHVAKMWGPLIFTMVFKAQPYYIKCDSVAVSI